MVGEERLAERHPNGSGGRSYASANGSGGRHLTEVVVVRTPELNRTRELVLGLGLQFSVVRLTLGFVRSVQGSGNGLVGYKWVIVVVVRFGLGLR